MRRIFVMLALMLAAASVAATPVLAAGGKNQRENGTATAPGPGDDAQDNQVSGG